MNAHDNLYKNVKTICNERGLKIGEDIEAKVGLKRGALSRRRTIDKVLEISDLLGVSVDTLLRSDLAKEYAVAEIDQQIAELEKRKGEILKNGNT